MPSSRKFGRPLFLCKETMHVMFSLYFSLFCFVFVGLMVHIWMEFLWKEKKIFANDLDDDGKSIEIAIHWDDGMPLHLFSFISTMIRKQNVPVDIGEMKETMTIASTMREPNTHVILTPMICYQVTNKSLTIENRIEMRRKRRVRRGRFATNSSFWFLWLKHSVDFNW